MRKWNIRQSDVDMQKRLTEGLGVSSVIAQLLINRNMGSVDQARTFLTGDIAELFNPFLMEGMHEVVCRIKRAVENKEKVLIHGDYDVDGITAASLLISVLRSFKLAPDYYIPDRLTEGYGLSEGGVKEAIDKDITLVITADCGITSYKEVEELNAHNIDVIITDHHGAPKVLPRAYSIINPLQEICSYPDKNLSGVGVVFKLCEALCSEFHSRAFWKHLDLVALGTISDVVPLIGENRILVREGLRLLNSSASNKGIQALIEAAGLKNRKIGSFEVGYILGPRINAAGRLGSADTSVELLLTDDTQKVPSLAKKLNEANRQRQKIEATTLKQAMERIEKDINFKDHKVIVLDNEDWHRGVIGIVASRISDKFYRPTIMISTKDGVGKGSGRSIGDFHLLEALTGCGGILKEYGGHKHACGLTILEEDLPQFKKIINEIADGVLAPEDLMPSLDIDMQIPLDSLDYSLVEEIVMLQPFGEGNGVPLFCSKNLKLTKAPEIIKNEHVKLYVTDKGKDFEAIGFGLARNSNIEAVLKDTSLVDLVYSVWVNTWKGINKIELQIEDVRPCVPSRP